MNAILTLAIQELPGAIAALRGLFAQHNPGVPLPTDAEVIAAFQAACVSSLAKDAAWLGAHPA
jgi:hypothetical protein